MILASVTLYRVFCVDRQSHIYTHAFHHVKNQNRVFDCEQGIKETECTCREEYIAMRVGRLSFILFLYCMTRLTNDVGVLYD